MYEYFCAVIGFSSPLLSTLSAVPQEPKQLEAVFIPPVLRFQRNCCQAIESHEKFCAKQKQNNRYPVVPYHAESMVYLSTHSERHGVAVTMWT
jgi:hypothetical protein